MLITDDDLREYFNLSQQIKALEEKREAKKEEFKKHGSKVTENFNLTVSTYQAEWINSLEKLIAKVGRSKLRGLLASGDRVKVQVTPRAKA
jgi:hypothetical protein